MYKQNIEKGQKIVIDAIMEGKEALILVPLSKNNPILYPVKESISIVKDIREDEMFEGMSILTLQFKNKTVDTKAFIDKSIKVGSVVSTIGFLTERPYPMYYTKGGINPVYNCFNEIPFDTLTKNKVFRSGIILELSEVTTPISTYSIKDEGVKPLEGVSGFYYIIEEKPKGLAMPFLEESTNEKPKDLLSKLSNLKETDEDYPDDDYSDEETPIGVGETNNQ